MSPPIGHNRQCALKPSRLSLVCDDAAAPAQRVPHHLLQAMLQRGGGYGIKGASWRQGRQQRLPARPRDAKAASRKLVKRLRKRGGDNPDVLRIAAELRRCNRRHRCLHPACPQCGRAVQRLMVRTVGRFLQRNPDIGPWRVLSIILPACSESTEADFHGSWDRYAAVLQEAGLTRGVFGLDVSFNEDHRQARDEHEQFDPHASVHLYGLAPAHEVEAAAAKLKQLVSATASVRRPIRTAHFDGNLAAIAYAYKPDFVRRQTIEQVRAGRANLVRTTRDRPLTVEQQISAVRALTRAGLTGRIMLLGLRLEIEPPRQARPASRT